VFLTVGCAECHGDRENFNFGGEDYDSDGVVEGVQSEVEGLLVAINTLYTNLNPFCTNITQITSSRAGVGLTLSNNPPITTTTMTSLRSARWNWNFVNADGSRGTHNPKYITGILRATIDDLMGRTVVAGKLTDVDNDGLSDQWEQQYFGSIWAQTGSGDKDGDGLSNAQEQAAGTDPTKADTDGDGVSDYSELVAGADPTSAASTLTSNLVTVLPAMELSYLPPINGATMRFEKVDSLISGTWTNVGSNFVSSSTNAVYQLVSPRDADQRFFRVKQLP
jgi:hypothetical protein